MEQRFETGRFRITEEEKSAKSPEELKKLEEKVERANAEKWERLREIYRKQLEESLAAALQEEVLTPEDISEWLGEVKKARQTEGRTS